MWRLDRKAGPGELTFGPTSGGISGVIGVLSGLGLAVVTLVHGPGLGELRYVFGGVAFAALTWAVLLRPRVRLLADKVELRNGFSEFLIPYAVVSDIAVRSFTVVQVDKKRYIGLAVGRSRTSMTRRRKDELLREHPDLASGKSLDGASEADLLLVTLEDRVKLAHEGDRGVPSPVQRHWSLPAIVPVAAFAALFVVSLFLG